jgi:hypothetical protein
VNPQPVVDMRRVIRHIVTWVTFERWSINWERSSTVDSSTDKEALEELFANNELGTSGQNQEKDDLVKDKAGKSEEIRGVRQLMTEENPSSGESDA